MLRSRKFVGGGADTSLSRRGVLALAGGVIATAASGAPPKICIFSKHLQWLSMPDAAALAAEIGFDGIDITVRQGGHVEPSRVAADLPLAVEVVRKAGLEVPMVTAGIVDTRSSHAEEILRVSASLGIRRYRWGGFRLDAHHAIPVQIDEDRAAVRDLAALNQRYNVCAMYHTHSGAGLLGASIWDLYLLLKDFDSRAVGVNYDIGHATIEGGLGGWRNSLSLISPALRGVALKDFYWEKHKNGVWQPRWCPIGDGMVNFPEFFSALRQARFSGPIQLHFEYPEMGGADEGKHQLTISRNDFIRKAQGDLHRVREFMRAEDLA